VAEAGTGRAPRGVGDISDWKELLLEAVSGEVAQLVKKLARTRQRAENRFMESTVEQGELQRKGKNDRI